MTLLDAERLDAAPLAPVPRRQFLPLPPMTAEQRRRHRLILGLLMGVSIALGAYWSVATIAWSPIDEPQHFGYVESLARGDGIPTVGEDLLSDDIMASVKDTPTLGYRSEPFLPDNDYPYWGATAHQYEAIHGPTYYVAMVPAYWVGQLGGEAGSLLTVRLATVMLGSLVLPLTWALARRLFPAEPVVWLMAPAMLAVINSLSWGTVTNDPMAVVLGTAATVVFLRGLSEERATTVLLAGGLLSLTLVTKSTSLVLVPFLGIAFVAWLVVARPGWGRALRWIGLFGAAAVLAYAPWLAWNLHAYGSPTAAEAVDNLTGDVLDPGTLDLDTIGRHASVARWSVWMTQLTADVDYRVFWEVLVVASFVVGAAAASLRRRWRDLAVLAWCASALPLAFASMEVIVFVLFGGTGGPMGRHLLTGMPPTAIMVAASLVLAVRARWAPVLMAWLLALSLVLHSAMASTMVSSFYLSDVIDDRVAPVVFQGWADSALADRDGVRIDAGCAVEAVGIGFIDADLPERLQVRTGGRTYEAQRFQPVANIPTYLLPEPLEGELTITLPPDHRLVRSTGADLSDATSFTTGAGDPVATAFCQVPDPEQVSFDLMYPPGHPDLVSRRALTVGPPLAAGASVLLAIGLTARAVGDERRRRSRAG